MNTLPHTQPDEPLVEGLARVVAVSADRVWLQAQQPAACGSCATHTVCSGSHSQPSGRWQVPQLRGPAQPLAVGDTVHVGIDRRALAQSSLIAYALPLLSMMGAAMFAQEAGDAVAVASALVGLVGGAGVARLLARRWRDALEPVVLGRASPAPQEAHASACAPSHASLPRQVAIPVVSRRSL